MVLTGVLCNPVNACEKHLQYTFIQSYKQTGYTCPGTLMHKKRHPFQNAFK